MIWTTLTGADDLAARIDHCLVVDCRHDLADPGAGRIGYAEGHVPGAVFVSMDEQLSIARNGRNGRHPMPSREQVRALLETLGLTDSMQLVVYDTAGGAMAARLWWMARWIGHEAVALLDGGLAAWQRAGYPLSTDPPAPRATGTLNMRPALATLVDATQTAQAAADPMRRVIDARPPERYRGEIERVDPVAGHIPGAVNRPWAHNLREDGRLKPAEVLRSEFLGVLGDRPASATVNSCGSGVSACLNLLAMAHAGLQGGALYGGSWSEWVSDPSRPVRTGAQP
jgi:thiosulfate/3-mercaptopyruvate sulfurtransferase